MTERVRITHPHDLYKGRIGYIVERIDQHSLCTYVIAFKKKGSWFAVNKRAYQRNELKFLKPIKSNL